MASPSSPARAHELPKKTKFFGRLSLLSKSKSRKDSSSKDIRPPTPPSNADFLRRKQEALQQYGLVSAKDHPRNTGGTTQGEPSAADAVRLDWERRNPSQSIPVASSIAGLCDSGRHHDRHRAQPCPIAAPPACDDAATLHGIPASPTTTASSSGPCPSLSPSSYAASITSTVGGVPVTPPYNGTFDHSYFRTAVDPSMYSSGRLVAEMDRVKRENPKDQETQRLTEMAFF